MSQLKITKDIDFYKTDIELVLRRLNYNIAPHDCTNVVLREKYFVGAFKLDYCSALNSEGKRIEELRLFWLSVTNESEIKRWKIGSFILEHCIDFARNEKQSFIYLSVNLENDRANYLYKKYGFASRNPPNHGEQDLELCVNGAA